MKKTVFVLSLIAMLSMGNRVVAQDDVNQVDESQSNGVFKMLAVYAPDFVAFRQVADKKIAKVDLYLVSGTTTAKPLLRRILKVGGSGWEVFCIAGSEFRFSNFEVPKTGIFQAEKIKIVADGVEMFYDIDKSVWEVP